MKLLATRLFFILTVLGLLAACYLMNDSGSRYFSLPGLLLIVFGTLGATALGRSPVHVLQLVRHLPSRLNPPEENRYADLQVFLKIAGAYRNSDIRTAEEMGVKIRNRQLRRGVGMVVSRTPSQDITRVMQWQVSAQRERDQNDIQIVRTMAAMAPAFGMLGTLFGLITMFYELDVNHISHIGESMGFAMVTTAYGLLFSNLLFRPVALRLENISRKRIAWMHFLAEIVVMLENRSHPATIRQYIRAFESGETETSSAVVAAGGDFATVRQTI
ncbi:MAG: hypothetical protein RIQ52_1761 [Pseudomonadota bacterium]|jgi:chemotaxis protein MotA